METSLARSRAHPTRSTSRAAIKRCQPPPTLQTCATRARYAQSRSTRASSITTRRLRTSEDMFTVCPSATPTSTSRPTKLRLLFPSGSQSTRLRTSPRPTTLAVRRSKPCRRLRLLRCQPGLSINPPATRNPGEIQTEAKAQAAVSSKTRVTVRSTLNGL